MNAPAAQVFGVLQGLGGKSGWPYANLLWQLRGRIDRWIGGVGMSRGRTGGATLQAGDGVDFWRVEKVVPGERISFRAEMKLPGRAWLQFALLPSPETARFSAAMPGSNLADWPASFTGQCCIPFTC